MAVGESTSPLFAESDRALASGRGRSALGRSNTASSFPIKKIAFKAQNINSGENNSTPPDADGGGGGGDSNNATTAIPGSSAGEPRKSLAQLRAERQQQEEFEAMKREAREAGLHGEFVSFVSETCNQYACTQMRHEILHPLAIILQLVI